MTRIDIAASFFDKNSNQIIIVGAVKYTITYEMICECLVINKAEVFNSCKRSFEIGIAGINSEISICSINIINQIK